MKKLLACLVITLLAALLPPAASPAEEPTFTLLIYLCGTDLETDIGAATADLYELMDAGLDPDGNINVVLELGGTKKWHMEEVDPNQNERWAVYGNQLICLQEMPRRDMGDPDTLQSFIEYGVSAFPADRYGLILWNHGSGMTGGVCHDEHTGNYLTTADIRSALKGASEKNNGLVLDFIGFDACLMASFEMANYVKGYARYMVASEEVSPFYGFDFASFLWELQIDPTMDTEILCRTIVDTFMDTNMAYDPDDYMTLSVIDLEKMDALTEELERVSGGLTDALESGAFQTISRYRQNMRSFGDYMRDNTSDMVDLKHYVEVYAGVSGADTGAFMRALDEAVVYSRYTQNNLENICGMSILVPFRSQDAFPVYSEDYDVEPFYPMHTEFITEYIAQVSGGDYVFSPGTPQRTSYAAVSGIMENMVTPSDSLWSGIVPQASMTPSLNAESMMAADEAPAEDGAFDGGYLAYSLSLSEEDMQNLAYVEGNLMMNVSEEDFECYVDLGYLQHTAIDWENNTVYSLFDGTWPLLEGQLVSMIDQTVTAKSRRSMIDVQVNGQETYLLVVFDEDRPGGEVIGYTEGYNENGLPVRGYHKLRPGDEIVPMYFIIYWDENDEPQYERFSGEPIAYTGEALTFSYYNLMGEGVDYAYAFCLNDLFGGYQFSDFVYFTL